MDISELQRSGLADLLASCNADFHTAASPDLPQALAATTGIVVLTDARRRITWCNAAFTRLTGYSLDDARGKSPGALLQYEGTDPDTVAEMTNRVRAGQPFRGVLRNRSRRGRVYWLDIDIQPLRDAAGALTGFVAVESDVTDSVQRHEHLRAIANSAVVGLVVSDADGVITGCNPQAEHLFDVQPGQLTGHRVDAAAWGLQSDDGRPLAHDAAPWVRAWRSCKDVDRCLIGLPLQTGTLRWMEVSSERIPGQAEDSWAVVSSFTDVTAQHAARTELEAERMRLRAALDGTQAGVWEWDLQTNEACADANCLGIGDYSPTDLHPFSFDTLTALLHPDDVPQMSAAVREHVADRADFFGADCRLRHRCGYWVWVRLRGRIAKLDAQGRASWMCGTMTDITVAKEAELKLQQAHTQLLALFELSPVAMSLSRLADGCFEQFNDAMVGLLGHTRDMLGQLSFLDVVTPEGHALAKLHHQQLLNVGRFGPIETELLHANGERIPVMLSGMRTARADGREHVWKLVQDLRPAKRLEQQLRTEARTDRLTGLPNRAAVMEQLDSCVARAKADPEARFALLFLDFDRFKLVNDTLGHDAGDQLLQRIAERLRTVLRASIAADDEDSMVARLGGDEFVVVLAHACTSQAAAAVARRMLEALSRPYRVEHTDIHSTASIGIVMGLADSGTAFGLLRSADTAMYEAKRAGRGTHVFFDTGMLERLSRAVQVEEALRHAIAREQLSVAYQPIVDLATGRASSAEALLRWRDPVLGEVSPAEFIPIAEESGLIVTLGEWVLRQACKDWRSWQDADPALAPAMISVNLSRVQMATGGQLLSLVASVLAEHGMSAGSLQLEVTEREAMRDPAAVRELMLGLQALGVRLAMDDFGTGVSSLGCLRDYPFDVIKIDKAFIDGVADGPATQAVLRGTISVIHELGKISVVEGVETAEQLKLLQSMGCHCAQGYLFSRQVPAGQLLSTCRTVFPVP